MNIRSLAAGLLAVLSFSTTAWCFGPLGHQMVGAIADEKLAGTPTAAIVARLLEGFDLGRVSTLPDQIKSWDGKAPGEPGAFKLPGHPGIEAQLIEFWKANPPSAKPGDPMPSHHGMHYTDVPLGSKYAEGKVGRNEWDVVHTISYCIKVLNGDIPPYNERKITKAVALIYLAHCVGDIHQPLHVGAEYFGDDGKPVNPDHATTPAHEDQGGNTLFLMTLDQPREHDKLHFFWDNVAVKVAFEQTRTAMTKAHPGAPTASDDLAKWFASQEPAGWRPPQSLALDRWSETWANEIMPFAQTVHARLDYQDITIEGDLAKGFAKEKPTPAGGVSYREWAGTQTAKEIALAGWRLAEVIKRVLR